MKIKLFVTYFAAFFMMGCVHDHHANQGQNEKIPHMVVASDLSNQKVMAFAEDSVGHLWVGTFRGLNRYTSTEFYQYFCTDDSIDLPDNQINDLYRDSQNRLWIATINGVAIYDNNDHFRQVKLPMLRGTSAQKLLETNKGEIFAAFNDFIARYNPESNAFELAISDMGQDSALGLTCAFDRHNNLWVASPLSIRQYAAGSLALVDSIPLSDMPSAFYFDPVRQNLCIGGQGQLRIMDLRTKQYMELPNGIAKDPMLADANIIQIYPYQQKFLLLNTSNKGVYAYDAVEGQLLHQDNMSFPFELPPYRVNRFFTDSQHNLWVGSIDHGIALASKSKKLFNANVALQSLLEDISVWGLSYDLDDNIWAACMFDGVLVYNFGTGHHSMIPASSLPGLEQSPQAAVNVVHADSKGRIWLASIIDGKVWKCRWDGQQLQVLGSYDMPRPHVISEDGRGNVWMGSGLNYLARYDEDNNTFDLKEVPGDQPCFVSGLAAQGDTLYISALWRPLLQYDLNRDVIEQAPIRAEQWDSCIQRAIFIPTDLVCDSYGQVWIGTVGNGLMRYNPQNGTVERIPGTPCTDISSLVEDKQGHMWVSTQYGLARCDRTSDQMMCYYASDGTGGNQYYDRASALLPNGMLVFGATHGLTLFDPVEIGVKRQVPLSFETLKMHNEIIDPLMHPEIIATDMIHRPEVHLGHNQNAFGISFAALDYALQQPAHYYYMLEGYDKYWIDARHANEAYYANVPPGEYSFKVKIADASNSLVDQELSIKIVVKGSMWLQWWAIMAYILIAAAAIWIGWTKRRQYLQRREAVRRDLEEKERLLRIALLHSPSSSEQEKESAAADINLSPADRKLVQELYGWMERELSNSELDITKLTEMMHISRSKLYYKVKALTGSNPAALFKAYKLNRAAELLKEGSHSVSEIADMTGFSTLAHFSSSFKRQFGVSPTEYR